MMCRQIKSTAWKVSSDVVLRYKMTRKTTHMKQQYSCCTGRQYIHCGCVVIVSWESRPCHPWRRSAAAPLQAAVAALQRQMMELMGAKCQLAVKHTSKRAVWCVVKAMRSDCAPDRGHRE